MEVWLLLVTQALINGLLLGGIYLLAAIGLNVVFGVLRIVNLAHGDFVMLGGYVVLVAASFVALPPFVLVFVALAFGVGFGLLVYFGVIDRIRDEGETSWIIVTFGLSASIVGVMRYVFGPTPHVVHLYSGSLVFGPFYAPIARLTACGTAIALTVLLVVLLGRTRVGKAVRALSQNPELAFAMGLPVRALLAGAFTVGSALAVAAGALLISVYSIDPEVGYGIVFKSFAIIALAGIGRNGAIAATALALGAAESVLALWVPLSITQLIAFVALLAVIVVRPSRVLVPRGV